MLRSAGCGQCRVSWRAGEANPQEACSTGRAATAAILTAEILARYPQVADQPLAMAMLCQVLRTKGLAVDAYALGQAAIDAAPENMEIRDMVRASLSAGVPAWHGSMLRDERRNRCYAQAIERLVRPGMLVLEIGAGAGLLSLLAARAGAQVVSCEMNPMVAAAADDIIRRNGFSERIRIIPKNSADLVVGDDLPRAADLLMSELFDDALFGDGIVDVIADARQRLLKTGALVLPPRASLRCALVSLERVASLPMTDVEGFDLSTFKLLSPAAPARLRARAETETQRSDVVSALAMDFDSSPFGPTRQDITLRSRGGRVDGIAQWMRIDFGDGVIYENDPFSGLSSHWGAPVFPLTTPIDTVEGQPITVTVRLVGAQLVMRRAAT